MLPILMIARRREANRLLIRHRRMIRNNSHPLELPDRRFIELFRLSKALAIELIELLTPHLHHAVRPHGISIEIMVLTALRFYATGGYQRSLGQDLNFALSQTSVHRCIQLVTTAIVDHLQHQYIRFPSTWAERQQVKIAFMDSFGLPGVIGAIDCTHVAILKPTVDEHNFLNRKGYHSINCQAVCDTNLLLRNLNVNYGGATHDAFIWRNSLLQTFLRRLHYGNGEQTTWLIGDSGYGLQPYLLTPVPQPPPNTPEAAYNVAHIAGRNCIERCFGVLKMRFRCVLKERVARYRPHFVASLVIACSVLHNMCIQANVPLIGDANDPLPDEEIDPIPAPIPAVDINLLQEGRRVRQRVINLYFQ